MFKNIIKNMSGLVLIGLLSGCGLGSSDEESSEPLSVQFVPTNNDGTMEAQSEPFAQYLTEQLGREVTVSVSTDYSAIVEAMDSGQVDIGIMPPAAYVRARESNGAEALLTSQLMDYDQDTGLPLEGELTNTFKGEILVRADSDMESIEDLTGRNIVTLSPNSASGYIYPVAEMRDAGIDHMNDVTLTTVSDIPSGMSAVLNGQMDAAFVFEGARNVFASFYDDTDLFSELRVLHLTDGDIPNDAIAVQPDMDEELKQEIKDVFLNMIDDEEGAEAMAIWGHQGYEEAAESAYDTIEEYTERAAE